jgi:hypothetical protein
MLLELVQPVSMSSISDEDTRTLMTAGCPVLEQLSVTRRPLRLRPLLTGVLAGDAGDADAVVAAAAAAVPTSL